MKGTCEVCGTMEVDLQEKNVGGQLKNVFNCAWDRLTFLWIHNLLSGRM